MTVKPTCEGEGMGKKPTLLFDGDCGFCSASVEWLKRKVEFEAVPFQFSECQEFGISETEMNSQVWLIEDDEKYGGAVAFARLLGKSQLMVLRHFGAFLLLPGVKFIAQKVYALEAKYRHLLPGGTPACRLR
ncbi:DUF393 domain-containing protein [Corynebacterium sp. 153RC1]|uniref:thiol-disulfide oxidoreductase DCC family protein n=1 Tax=unclassified Corynebacterium TaxID=2624378 RepID=UPI00211B7F73|nr:MULTISPECIES: DUF393 domain-containing protein [unclassified Corynebacterium]MCQ9353123.1 DUF393 domain-containing protein [Corynebacterium sp. 209RC1]MCQ9355327.1 DUF393 domain-containing protein [Corynebacterium sp. 1222RC1]MCQ9357614.1 DUF393 domain-containing protein [Corynebacterium sp. 122RC1]MCQ9359272.1 DUF393 domain-containing protein [Corynebacterium sp. 142RC1]MCQ9361861.1 DUF393 domain-containing protein [Corynebacterium sp. 153RC1]